MLCALWDRKNKLYWTGYKWESDPRKARLYGSSTEAWEDVPFDSDKDYLMVVDEDEDDFWGKDYGGEA